jgi:hypothetical protein
VGTPGQLVVGQRRVVLQYLQQAQVGVIQCGGVDRSFQKLFSFEGNRSPVSIAQSDCIDRLMSQEKCVVSDRKSVV